MCACVCVGEGGHGYLKDWLWWGGLLTSKNLFLVTLSHMIHLLLFVCMFDGSLIPVTSLIAYLYV